MMQWRQGDGSYMAEGTTVEPVCARWAKAGSSDQGGADFHWGLSHGHRDRDSGHKSRWVCRWGNKRVWMTENRYTGLCAGSWQGELEPSWLPKHRSTGALLSCAVHSGWCLDGQVSRKTSGDETLGAFTIHPHCLHFQPLSPLEKGGWAGLTPSPSWLRQVTLFLRALTCKPVRTVHWGIWLLFTAASGCPGTRSHPSLGLGMWSKQASSQCFS